MRTVFQSATGIRSKKFASGKTKVLLMKNDPGIRKIFQRLLKEARYCVMQAGSCTDALKFAATARLDLMLLNFPFFKKVS